MPLRVSRGTHEVTAAELDGLDQTRMVVLYHEQVAEITHTEVSPAKKVLAKWVIIGYETTSFISRSLLGFGFMTAIQDHQNAAGNSQIHWDNSKDDGDTQSYAADGAKTTGFGSGWNEEQGIDTGHGTQSFQDTDRIYIRLFANRSNAGTTKIKKLKTAFEFYLSDGAVIHQYTLNKTKTFTVDVLV